MAASGPAEPLVVDAAGLRCPLPVIRLAAAARDAAPGTVVVVRSTDPAAGADIAAWCRMRGHEVVQRDGPDEAGISTTRLRLGGRPAAPAPAAPPPAGGGTPPG